MGVQIYGKNFAHVHPTTRVVERYAFFLLNLTAKGQAANLRDQKSNLRAIKSKSSRNQSPSCLQAKFKLRRNAKNPSRESAFSHRSCLKEGSINLFSSSWPYTSIITSEMTSGNAFRGVCITLSPSRLLKRHSKC